ncbi:hypothetical protein ASG54_14045 [Aureimonas sp. Leaf460]|nr:hypothetical protein ASG54_14045 [Aureimonas sp. Leaf460]
MIGDDPLVASKPEDAPMSLTTILLIIVILILIGVFPAWPHSRGWGYGPSGLLGVIVVVVLILILVRGGV